MTFGVKKYKPFPFILGKFFLLGYKVMMVKDKECEKKKHKNSTKQDKRNPTKIDFQRILLFLLKKTKKEKNKNNYSLEVEVSSSLEEDAASPFP